jgi:hypothetical protein
MGGFGQVHYPYNICAVIGQEILLDLPTDSREEINPEGQSSMLNDLKP